MQEPMQDAIAYSILNGKIISSKNCFTKNSINRQIIPIAIQKSGFSEISETKSILVMFIYLSNILYIWRESILLVQLNNV